MVRTLLAMRWTLYRRQFTGGTALVKTFFGIVGLALAVGLCVSAAGSGATISVSLVALGVAWVVAPVLSGLSDDNLHPRQFVLLPVQPTRFAGALLASSAVGMVVPITVVATAAIPVYAASRSPAALPFAIVLWPASAILLVALSRVVMSTVSGLLRSRRSRELAMLVFGSLFAGIYLVQFPVLNNLGRVVGGETSWPTTIAKSIPFAWGIAGVDFARDARWSLAAATVVGLVALDVVLVLVWRRLVVRGFDGSRVAAAASGPSKATGSSRTTENTGLSEVAVGSTRGTDRGGWRASPTGAVVVRELSLWRGDPTRRSQILSLVMALVLSGVGPLVADSLPFSAAWVPWFVFVTALGAGANLYGYDGGSMWHLVMTPSAARADVLGRQLAWCLLVAPFAVLPIVVVRVFGTAGLDRVAVPISSTLALLGVGAGLVVAISTRAAYYVSPSKSTFSMNVRGSFDGTSFLMTLSGFVCMALAVIPTVVIGLVVPGAASFVAVPVGAVIGLAGFLIGGTYASGVLKRDGDLILRTVASRS